MTIIYQYRVATTSLGGFLRLLTIWRGSVYKLMYKEILIFSSMYAAISLTYRFALNDHQRSMFERLVIHCSSYTNLIPVSFVLGFYVSIVVARWWQQFINVPWPDRTLFMTITYLHGHDERARMFRRTLARYMILGLILICRSISVAVMKRFPTMEHVIDAGFMTKEEVEIWESVQCKYHKFWVPLTWANNVLVTARREERIESDWGLRMIIQQLSDFRDKCSLLFVYDWITIPLVYTQVVTLAVYTFFASCLVARQYLDPEKGYEGYGYDLYVPVFTLLQFFFYMGWLKVAEQLINPFGEDDDDYDINWLLDRHTAVSMTLIDQCYGKHPPLIRDMYWNENIEELPYTEASYASKRPNFLGSTYNIARPSIEEQRIVHDLAEVPTRRSSISSTVAGSLLSLFSRRHSMTKLHLQQDCLIPLPKREDRAMSVPNGGAPLLNIPGMGVPCPNLRSPDPDAPTNIITNWSSDSDLTTRSSEEPIEQRQPTQADIEGRSDCKKAKIQRKFSFPINLLRRRDTNRMSEIPSSISTQANGSRVDSKQTRFLIAPVDIECEGTTSNRRNSQKLEKVFASMDKPYTKIVSRPPLLSSIEEQNTVTSLTQVLPQQQQQLYHLQKQQKQQKQLQQQQQQQLQLQKQQAVLAEPEVFDEDSLSALTKAQRRGGVATRKARPKSGQQYVALPPILVQRPAVRKNNRRMTGWLSDSDLNAQRPSVEETVRLRQQQRRLFRRRARKSHHYSVDSPSDSEEMEEYGEEEEEGEGNKRERINQYYNECGGDDGDEDGDDGGGDEEGGDDNEAALKAATRRGHSTASTAATTTTTTTTTTSTTTTVSAATAAAVDACSCSCSCQIEQQQRVDKHIPERAAPKSSTLRVQMQAKTKPSPPPPPLPLPPTLIKQPDLKLATERPRTGGEPISPRRLKQYQPTVHFQPEVVQKDKRAQASRLQLAPPALSKAPSGAPAMNVPRHSVLTTAAPRPPPPPPSSSSSSLVHSQPPPTPNSVIVNKTRSPASVKTTQETPSKRHQVLN